jgi:hypothetical protein
MENIDDILDYAYKNNLTNEEIEKLIHEFENPKPFRDYFEREYKTKFHKFIFEYQIMLFIIGTNILTGIIVYLCAS